MIAASGVGASRPTMREWSGCGSVATPMRAGFHSRPARVLAMATIAAGTGIGAPFSREVSALGGSSEMLLMEKSSREI